MAEKIIQRIDGVLKHINRVQKTMNNVSFEQFSKSDVLPEAISFNIVQIGERMNKLEELLADRYPDLPWKEARKMRNVIVHDYDNVDYEKVYLTSTKDLLALKDSLLKIKDDINHISESSLRTERLVLRPWDDFDADELFELAKEPEIGYWCGWEPHKHIRDTFFALHNFLEIKESYAICLKENGAIIGSVSLKFKPNTDLADKDDECELGFWIGKPYWNKGFATEAAKEITRHGFEDLNASIIWAANFEGNQRSAKVQEKLRFVFRRIVDKADSPQSQTTKKIRVSFLNKEEWLKSNKKN